MNGFSRIIVHANRRRTTRSGDENGNHMISRPPELSGKQGDTLLGSSVREILSGRIGAFGLFGVRRFPRLWICLTPHCSAVGPIDTAHGPQRGDSYQPKVQTLGTTPDTSTRSEGTPQIGKCRSLSDPSLCGVPSERIPVPDVPTHSRAMPIPGLHLSLVGIAPLGREMEGSATYSK